ncbi:hypothetical protein PHMEG_00032074, partial [Phytophthora megakarya]
ANDSGSDSESDGSGGSDSDVDSHRKIFLATNEDVTPKMEKEPAAPDPRLPERDQGHQDHNQKIHDNGFNRDRQQDPDLWLKPADQEVTPEIQRPNKVAEYRRSTTMDLLPGDSRGYWKHHSPGKWFRQAKITGKIPNEKAILLLDTGAEVSIVDTAFARKIGCYIDSSQIQDCVGIGDNVYQTEGKTRIKVILAGSLVYFFDIRVGDLTGQQAILGMDFMVPAGIRLDLAHGSISLPGEVRIQLSGRRQLYSDKAKIVNVGQYLRIKAGESMELPLCLRLSIHDKLWVTRRDQWVPTISNGPGRTKYIAITNIGDEVLILHQDQRIGIWLAGDHVPRIPGFISIGSRRYME